MRSYPQKTTPYSLKTMKPDTTAPEDELDNDDISDGESGAPTFIDKSLGLCSENDDNFNNDACMMKRAKNNSRERERKEKIKNDMVELRSLLPLDMQSDKKQTHHDMLQLTISYLRSLLYQSNSLKLNQITVSSNQNDRETDLHKEVEDLRLELAKYKSFLSNAGLPPGIDLSQILINWRLKTPDELIYNPNVNVDVNLPIFQQQFNHLQQQGILQNISGNQQTLTQFAAMTNQAQQLQPATQQIEQQQQQQQQLQQQQLQQQLAFNQNQLQQISFAQQSFSLTQHSEFPQFQQNQQQFQHQQLGFVQQNVQQTYAIDSVTPSENTTHVSNSSGTHLSAATLNDTASHNPFQDFLPEERDFTTSLETSTNNNNNSTNNADPLATLTANNDDIVSDQPTIQNVSNVSVKNDATSNEPNDNDVQTSFIEDQNLLSKNSLTGLLTSNDLISTASSSSTFVSLESSTSDSALQQQLSNNFQDGQMKSSTTFNVDGTNFDSDNRFESFGNSLTISQQQMQHHHQLQQPQIIGQQQFHHYGPNSELLADGSSSSISLAGSNDPNSHQGMQGSLIFQNGQLILVNNSHMTSNALNQVNNQQQFQQNFFMQAPQQPNVLTQQNGFLSQGSNMTLQADQLLGQQQGATQFVGQNGSINILSGHGLQTIPQTGGQMFQNPLGIINPVNVLGGSMNQNFNHTLTMNPAQGHVMMPHKTSDQPQALILPDGQIIPVVTQPNLLFPSQQCIPVTGSLLVPSMGASQSRTCGLSSVMSAKPQQPVASVASNRSKKKQMSQLPSSQNVTLPPSMTAVLTPEGNVILSFPTASANQNAPLENKSNASIAGAKSTQRPLMPKPSNLLQQQNIFDTKMFTTSQTPFFQNVLNIQPTNNLPVLPLIHHQQVIQPLAVPTDMNDFSNRGIECISPPITQSGDQLDQSTNYNSSFNQMNNQINGAAGFLTTNQNEVTTSTGAVEPMAANCAKKKVKKKKKKRLSTVATNEKSNTMATDSNNKISVGDLICGHDKEVDITDFSDLIRMEPMTPRPSDARLTPSHQFPQTPTMSTPLMTSQVKHVPQNNSSEVALDEMFKMESQRQVVGERTNITNSLEVVDCSLGDFNSSSFPENLLIASSPKIPSPSQSVAPSMTFQSFSTVSMSPSLVSVSPPTFSCSTSQIASSCDPNLFQSTSDSLSSTNSMSNKTEIKKKQGKQARKSLDFRDHGTNLNQNPAPPVSSTGHSHRSDSSINDSSKLSLITSNCSISSIQNPISSIIPLIKGEPKRGTKRLKTSSQSKSSRPKKTSRADDSKLPPTNDNPVKSLSRRTRSQSKSHETSVQQIAESSSVSDVSNNLQASSSPPSKKRNIKHDQPISSALKVSPPTMNRQLVVSVEKLDDVRIKDDHSVTASYQTGSTPPSENNNNNNVPQNGDEGNHVSSVSEAFTTTEEGTQTLRSELKLLKQERRAKKYQDKKKKHSDKKTSNNSGMMQPPPTGALVDDSVQLDIELFNLVDQVERNMVANQTDQKCRTTKISRNDIEDVEEAKRLKIDESGNRGKENSITMKLKRVDNHSNFVVESPVDCNLDSTVQPQINPNSYSPVHNSSNPTLRSGKESMQITNTQHEASDNSFYGSRYLPNTLDVVSSVRDFPYPNKNNEDSNHNKPYFVLKQPNLSRTDSTDVYDGVSHTSNNITAGNENSIETRDVHTEDRSKGGHAILQSLAKNIGVPSKQVSSKMAAQMARQEQIQKDEAEGKCTKRINKKSKTEEIEKCIIKDNGDAHLDKERVNHGGVDCHGNQDADSHKAPAQQVPSPNCYDLSLTGQSKNDKQNSSKPPNRCTEIIRPKSRDHAMPSCAVTTVMLDLENQHKSLPSCNQEKEKTQKEQDTLLDCTYQNNHSKPVDRRNLNHQEDYQLGQVAKQHDDGQSNRRRSRNEDEEKRSSSTGYHQANHGSYAGNPVAQSGHSYYKDQSFAGTYGNYYMPNYFDVLQASSSRFIPFEPSPTFSFFRDCASVFPSFQTPTGSFGSDFSCQRGANSLGKEAVEPNCNRRSVESNNRNSLDSNGRNSHHQQAPPLPSCKSVANSYLDNQQHQTHSADKSKQSSNAKKTSKTPVPSYDAFDHINPFNFAGLSPSKNHHHHLPSPYFQTSNFLPEASRNKGSTSSSRTLHHRGGVEDGFNKISPSVSSGVEFPSQEFSRHQQQSRTNTFIGNSVPAHHSLGLTSFFSDPHQMTPPLGHRGVQPSPSNYYNSYNQQQAMGSMSRNNSISRPSNVLNPEMTFNHLWGHQQATFDPTRNPFSTYPFSM